MARPLFEIDKAGLVYSRLGKEQRLAWSEITAILTYHQRKEIHFVSSHRRIAIHRDMVAPDGRRFDILVDNYWKAPKKGPADLLLKREFGRGLSSPDYSTMIVAVIPSSRWIRLPLRTR